MKTFRNPMAPTPSSDSILPELEKQRKPYTLELKRLYDLDRISFEKPPADFNGIWNRPSVSYRNKIHFLYASHEFSKQELINILTF